jgi:NAD-dependent SIR2 family protein deacetylase
MVRRMILSQGFVIGEHNDLTVPEGKTAAMRVPTGLLPKCPNCGRPLTTNLRADDRFVEDAGWQASAVEYELWLTAHRDKKVVFLEIGVGFNTPGIIKYSFWQEVYQNKRAFYACLNMEESPVPDAIRDRAILLQGGADDIIRQLITKESCDEV